MDSSAWNFFIEHRPAWLVDVAKVLAFIGDETVLLPLTLLVAAAAFLRGRRSFLAVAPFVAMISTAVVVAASKVAFGRERPPLDDRLVEVGSASMPSGHAAYAAALAAVAWVAVADRENTPAARAAAVTLAVLAGLARLVLGVHWLSDVLAGWVVGAMVGAGVVSLLRRRLQSA
ncbi:MAG: phosphatase PAP2 family protein [Acidimicrobiia bacterium]